MAMFKAFKPSGMEKIARAMGYSGNMQGFQDYLAQDPMRQQQMQTYQQKAMQMAKGGMVRMQQGGLTFEKTGSPLGPLQGVMGNQNPMYKGVGATTQTQQNAPPAQIGTFPMNPPIPGIFDTPNDARPQPPGGHFVASFDDPRERPQPVTQPAANTGSVAPGTLRVNNDRYIDLRGLPDAMRIQEASNVPSGQPLSGRQQPLGLIGTVAPGVLPAVGDGLLQPPNSLAQALPAQRPFDLSSYVPEFIPDTSKVKPEDQLRREYEQAQANAKARRDAGFMGRVLLPGEMPYEGWKQLNQYELMRNPNFTGQPPQQPQTQLPQQAVPTFAMPQPTQQEITEFVDDEGNVYPSQDVVPDGVNVTEQTRTVEVPPTAADITMQQFAQPGLPAGGAIAPVGIQATPDQMIDPTTGQVTGVSAVPTAMAKTYQAEAPEQTEANLMQATTAAGAIDSALNATQAAQLNPNDPRAQVAAAQQTATSVGSLDAAQGNAVLMDNPTQREIQAGELISGAADAQKAAQFTEQVQAAQATPSDKATVQGQLEGLLTQFEGGQTPAWAAGAMRAATAKMAARGLGASSVAGQAIVQAAMESALPIAQADAATIATFEQQNLSNRQQRAMLAAQQRAAFMGQEFDQAFQARVTNAARIADIANMNFTAEQQVALENSRIANSMNLANLSNSQALVMAEAAALAQMDSANLNNRQQAAVMNAQNFMQRDLANLSNRQQTDLFKAQQRVQSLFNDQSAVNAAAQFNATSQNQVDQFFATLANNVSQFNATQANAQAQFNAGERNVLERFNAELNNQRDQFNATNQLAIAQSNAVWRREIATANTAAINRANELNATAVLDISKTAYDNLWQYYADTMEWAWTSAENELNRIADMAIANLNADERAAIAREQGKTAAGSALGSLIGTIGSAWIGAKFCWVAREVYGTYNSDWLVFRNWLRTKAPKWLYRMYEKYGENFAEFISNKPKIKKVIKLAMDKIVTGHKKEYLPYVK